MAHLANSSFEQFRKSIVLVVVVLCGSTMFQNYYDSKIDIDSMIIILLFLMITGNIYIFIILIW